MRLKLLLCSGLALAAWIGLERPSPSFAGQLDRATWWLERASREAQSIEDAGSRQRALELIRNASARHQSSEAAVHEVETVLKNASKESGGQYFRKLGERLALAGQPDAALKVAEAMERLFLKDSPERRWVWSLYRDIITEQARQGRIEAALATAAKVAPENRAEALAMVAGNWGRIDLHAAFKYARSLSPPHRAMAALASHAAEQHHAAVFEQALELAVDDSLALDHQARSVGLTRLTGVVSRSRILNPRWDSPAARRLENELTKLAADSDDPELDLDAALNLVKLNALDEAERILSTVGDRSSGRLEVIYGLLAQGYAELGELEKALHLSPAALPVVARKQAEAGEFKQAIESAPQIDEHRQIIMGDWRRNEALREIAAEQAGAGLIDQSLSTIRLIGPTENRSYAEERFKGLLNLAEILDAADNGQEAVGMLKRAEALLKQFPERIRRNGSEDLARAYQSLRAEEYLRGLADTATGLERADIMTRLAAGYLEGGDHERYATSLETAIRAVQTAEEPDHKQAMQTWFRIAAVAHDGGRVARAAEALKNLRDFGEAALANIGSDSVMARVGIWGMVAVGYARLDKWDDLPAVIEAIEDPFERSLGYYSVAVFLQQFEGQIERLKTAPVFPEARAANSPRIE
ncbi:MAG: hypothetical protein KY476_04110 [Planctomycetes bacterium]|nr:hypothetical protein [Planctomycetota bacterium]